MRSWWSRCEEYGIKNKNTEATNFYEGLYGVIERKKPCSKRGWASFRWIFLNFLYSQKVYRDSLLWFFWQFQRILWNEIGSLFYLPLVIDCIDFKDDVHETKKRKKEKREKDSRMGIGAEMFLLHVLTIPWRSSPWKLAPCSWSPGVVFLFHTLSFQSQPKS